MNRRHFVKLTGASLASVLITNYTGSVPAGVQGVRPPDSIQILLSDHFVPLVSADKQRWTYKDITIQVVIKNNIASVFVESPSMPVREVQLGWNYKTPKKANFSGDAWERSYGDLSFQPANALRKMPWYFIQYDADNVYCFGVKTGCSSFCFWQVSSESMHLHLDIRNSSSGVQLGNRTLHAADIISTKNSEGENVYATARRFCSQLCENPRSVKNPVYGINDWYFAYGNNSAELILKHTALLAPLASDSSNLPFSVIDDGWSLGTDFTHTNEKFPDMPKLVEEIKNLGMRPGLWTRPLLAKPGTDKNRFIHDGVLDPTIDENIEHVKTLFKLYKNWGFEMVKHDYSSFDIFQKWGMEMKNNMTDPGWQFSDRSKTNAEIIAALYAAIREASGDLYLIGCNTISHLSAGVFELNRIGDDTSGKEWSRTKKMGVNTMAFRMMQHKTFYQADGDCVGLTTAISWEKNKQWMQLLAESSAPLFISAQPEAVHAEQKEFIRKCFSSASKEQPVAEPIDWLSNPFPAKWKLNNLPVQFNWD